MSKHKELLVWNKNRIARHNHNYTKHNLWELEDKIIEIIRELFLNKDKNSYIELEDYIDDELKENYLCFFVGKDNFRRDFIFNKEIKKWEEHSCPFNKKSIE